MVGTERHNKRRAFVSRKKTSRSSLIAVSPTLPAAMDVGGAELFHAARGIDWASWEAEIEDNVARTPFYLGWRYPAISPPNQYSSRGELLPPCGDGERRHGLVPINNMEELMHPINEDREYPNKAIQVGRMYLAFLWDHFLNPDYKNLCDHRVVWADRTLGAYGPDFFVFDNEQPPELHGDTYYFFPGDRGAVLVLEFTTHQTMKNDMVVKPYVYHRGGVENYIIVDLASPLGTRILSYRHTPGGYEQVAPNEHGWVRLPFGDFWLGLEEAKGSPVTMYFSDGRKTPNPLLAAAEPTMTRPKPKKSPPVQSDQPPKDTETS